MRTFQFVQPLALSAFILFAAACGTPSQNEEQPLVSPDEQQQPGNDGGLDRGDILNQEGGATTDGTVNSYTGIADQDSNVYQATVGGTEDNPNFSGKAVNNGLNDPLTPNAPLADGTAGQPGQAVPTTNSNPSVRSQNADAIQGSSAVRGADRPYGNNESSPSMNREGAVVTQEDLREYVAAEDATNMPVYAPGTDLAYVNRFYGPGSAGPRNTPTTAAIEDNYQISLYSPAMSDVTAATYTNTQTKLFPKPGAQNFVQYQPMQLKFVPLVSWQAATATSPIAGERLGDSAPRLGSDCGNSDDPEGCSSKAFADQLGPILNDPRVSRSITQDRIDAFRFELDAQGKLDPRSLVVMADGKPCVSGDCARFRSLVSGVIAQQSWTPASREGSAVATRVMVPLRYEVGTNKNLLE